MSFVHDEGKLRFAFDDDWKILKWDDHGAYVGGLQRFQETKAVDFFGLYLGEPYFIEVKEEDRPPEPALASTLGEAIKRELTWLNPRVLVTSRSLVQSAPVHGLVVTHLS
ncbi:hypothetical protein WMF38_31615 [Sorangium sp. So ce118]